ncbi:dihydrofolate reductase family protein [Mesorhizobium sp.]|uniref:dihydrofolate reductase family protein n=1 Tax=Mesorhizobium sp. TaxID=1871066 RepID=UPI00257C9125|nr:dihydrofolate reductase family protein [Mesorhizobium sp.]
MRKLIVTEFISVDGIAEVERLPGVTWNDEMQRFKEDELADSGAMLLGRTTYEIFAGSWPKETGDFADRFNALPKYVASTSLKALDWKPAELLKGALPQAVRQLKQGSGGNIYVHGSLSVAQELLRRRPGQAAVPVRRAGAARADLGHTIQQRRGDARVCGCGCVVVMSKRRCRPISPLVGNSWGRCPAGQRGRERTQAFEF